MAHQIFVADDNKEMREVIRSHLENDGFSVDCYGDGTALIAACENRAPDLVITNVLLPKMDGLSICARLRRTLPQIPVILLSARDDAFERVTGFTFGCDDYVVIPFLPLELVARVRAVLRRCGDPGAATQENHRLIYGPLTLDPEQRTACIAGTALALTPAEFDFLAYLAERGGTAVSRKELLKNLWKSEWQADTRATDDLVKRLRRKLREIDSPVRIETVWGFGFRLALDEAMDEAK